MVLEFMTPDVWNGLILGVVFIGLALAILRLYRDLSRPPLNRQKSQQKLPQNPDDKENEA